MNIAKLRSNNGGCAGSAAISLTARTGSNDVYADLSSRVGNVAADGAPLALSPPSSPVACPPYGAIGTERLTRETFRKCFGSERQRSPVVERPRTRRDVSSALHGFHFAGVLSRTRDFSRGTAALQRDAIARAFSNFCRAGRLRPSRQAGTGTPRSLGCTLKISRESPRYVRADPHRSCARPAAESSRRVDKFA